jgi:hypothetical protein
VQSGRSPDWLPGTAKPRAIAGVHWDVVARLSPRWPGILTNDGAIFRNLGPGHPNGSSVLVSPDRPRCAGGLLVGPALMNPAACGKLCCAYYLSWYSFRLGSPALFGIIPIASIRETVSEHADSA